MEMKSILFVCVVIFAVNTTSARPRRISRGPCSCATPPKAVYFANVATPFPACIETIDCVRNSPKTCCSCKCDCSTCNDQLILPPQAAELPYGLGYFPSALPLVAKSFDPALEFLTTGAYLPVASPCDCLTLAAPVCPEWAPLVRPICL